MRRDARYGAALALAAIFFCFFMYSRTGVYLESRPAHTVEPSTASTLPSGDIRGLIPGFPVNINSASLDELMVLPGIGPATARRILEKRAYSGGFTSVEQLTEVKWIGKVKLDKIRELVTVD
jgi:competence protein ComEA